MKVELCLRLATVLANELNMILGENRMTLYQQLRSEMENHRGFWNYYDMKFEDVFQKKEPRVILYIIIFKEALNYIH